jgi:hypothetical protein
MRLYPKGAPQAVIDHPVWGHHEAIKGDGEDAGGFELPDELSDELHSFHYRGKRIWETEDERSERRQREGLAHRRDPAALYETVSDMADLTRALAAVQLGQSSPVPADPQDEIAALKRRLAELEGGAPKGEPEVKPETRAVVKVEPDFKAEPKGDAKPEHKPSVKPRPGSAKDTPAA